MAMAMAMSVGGHRSLSSGAFLASQIWSRGSRARTRARVRAIPVVEAVKMEGGSGNAKKGEVIGREMAHSSARSLTICNVAGVSFDNANANAEVESKEETARRLCGPPLRGKPLPFGATACEEGVNFAVHSSGAKAVSLCLFTEADLQQGLVTEEVPLHPILIRTGNVWYIFLPDLQSNLLYGYRVDGPFLREGCLL